MKNHFNDPRPRWLTYRITCPSCRATVETKVEFYPHTNHRTPRRACPMCDDPNVNYKDGVQHNEV